MLDNRYIADQTQNNDYYEEGLLNTRNLIVGSAIAAGSLLAYKSGALAPFIKQAMKGASEHKPTVSVAFNDLRKWFKSDGEEETVKSIFRMGVKDTVKEFAKFDKANAKEVIKHTKEDIRAYTTRLNLTLDRLMKDTSNEVVNNTYHNTKILREIREADNAANFYSTNLSNSKNALRSKMYDEIIKGSVQTSKQAAKSLKRTGYRRLELNDVFDIVEESGKIKLYAKTKFNFDEKSRNEVMSAREHIEKMLNSNSITSQGSKVVNDGKYLKMHQTNKDYKHIAVDDSMHIDTKGNIIDLRNRRASNIETIRNLATEWQIPIIGVNPLQMFGVDKIGRRTIKFATVSENTLAPALTGAYGRSKSNTIAKVKNSNGLLKGVKEGVTIINGDVYRVSDDLQGIAKIDYKSKKHITAIPKEMDYGTRFLTRNENAQRKMFGLSRVEFEEFGTKDFKGKMGKYRYYKNKMAKALDIGHQESRSIKDALELEDAINPDSYIEILFSKLRFKSAKGVKETKTISGLSDFKDTAKDSFFITNDGMKFKELITDFNKNNIKRFTYQHVGNFGKDFESVNSRSSGLYFMTERLNQLMSSMGMGLSLDSTKSTFDVAKNLLLKRFLPAYGAYQAWNFINMFGENNTEGGTKPGNLEQHMASGYVKLDVGFHNIADKLGISKIAKGLSEITPGSDMIGELPGVNLFKPTQTAKERADYWQNGYDPVRKGRYWAMNQTPFVGGKIQYWRPNLYRRSLADAKFSDSMYGSRVEMFSNILNPRHYDIKNYNTRPYLMTSPAFENVPLFGPILSGTIGKVIAPQRMMHPEYWDGNRPKSLNEIHQEELMRAQASMYSYTQSQEQLQYNDMRRVESSKEIQFNSKRDLGYVMSLKQAVSSERIATQQRSQIDNFWVSKIFGFNQSNTGLVSPDYYDGSFNSSLIAQTKQNNGLKEIYKTNSGAMRIIQLNGEYANMDKNKLNKKGYALGDIMTVNENATAKNSPILTNDMFRNAKFANPENPNSIMNTLKNQYKNSSDVAGMYGFLTTDFVTGTPGAGRTMIETSGYSRSFNKAFYDENMGGLTGNLSEIFRRFVQKRRNDETYYNPIRNTMPNWLPGGNNNFTDFLHGDPYTKVEHGEERLPGEGYERLHGMSMPTMLKMKSGSSTIGKTKDEIIKHFLHQDEITDPELMKIVNKGTQLHADIEKQLLDSGAAIDTEVEMKDEKNGIIGYYDAKIHDRTALSGEAIVDIKTVGAKKLDKIRKAGKPIDYHQRQVNWYLHETNPLNKGYIYYVDREDPTNNYTVSFGYSQKMYDSTINTLQQARQDVGEMLHKGQLSRGDLYDPIDRFRVLADVAPYSDEFKIMNKQISHLSLEQKDMDEVKAIRDRVQAQRQQTRFYGYRFKHNDAIVETGTIDRQIDKQAFTIKGSDTPIKLAGLKLNKTDNPNYEKAVAFLNEHMGEGKDVKILVAEDSTQRANGDFMGTTKATVISDGMNINHELIKRGWAEENTEDFSAAGVHARFNGLERTFGSAWETMAHLDTAVNSKLLQVRTAKEDYERKQVYGKEFKSWTHPVKDFVEPFVWTNMNRNPIIGIGMGAAVGFLFGKTSYGRFLGASIGGLSIAGAQIYKKAYEAHTGERWIPEAKRKQRDMDDYLDKIAFIKNRRLFEVYADKAMKEDKFDVKKFITQQRAQGEQKKARAKQMKDVKKDYKRSGEMHTSDFEKVGVKFNWQDKMPSFIRGLLLGDNKNNYQDTYNRIMDFGVSEKKQAIAKAQDHYSNNKLIQFFNMFRDKITGKEDAKINPANLVYDSSHRRGSIEKQWKNLKQSFETSVESSDKHKKKALEKSINASINDNTNSHKVFNIPKNAMKAVEYYNASEATMYAYDPGEPLTNIMAAMPKKDKNYFREFLKAPQRDRKEILEMAPKYMRRALQSAYGMPVDPKEDLNAYFQKHALPDEAWDGWQENYDLKALKVKMVQSQGEGTLQENNLWQDDKLKADMYGPTPLPNMNYKTKNIQEVKNKLEGVLGQAGYKNLNFSFKFGANTPSINLDVYQNSKDQYDNKLKERLGMQ